MLSASTAGLLLKGSSVPTAAGGSVLSPGSPPAQDIAAVGFSPSAAHPLWRPLVPLCSATGSVLLSRQVGQAANAICAPSRVRPLMEAQGGRVVRGMELRGLPMSRHRAKQSSAPDPSGFSQPPLLTWNKGALSLLRTCCNALSCLLIFVSVLEQQLHLALKRLPHAITERRSWRTQCWSRETFEINLKGIALFSSVPFGCPVILYVDYNRKIKFLIFSPLYLEKCKISFTWSLWALLSQICSPILCHCHLLDDDLLVFIHASTRVALVNKKVPVSKSAHPNST